MQRNSNLQQKREYESFMLVGCPANSAVASYLLILFDYLFPNCRFVHDSILEEHALGKDVAPVPCQWKYVTEVPKIQVLIFPQSTPKVTANQDLVKTMPQTVSSPASNIVKYAAKVSATDLLEKSKKKWRDFYLLI